MNTDHNIDCDKIRSVAECSWWKYTGKRKLAELFNLTERQVDALRKTPEYKECVFDLMLKQWSTLEEFNEWVNNHYRIHGDMGKFGRQMGLNNLEEIRAMVEGVRKKHAEIAAGKAKAPEPILDPYKRPQNYKHTLYRTQEKKCNGCGVVFPFRNMTIDHIIPRSKDGTDNLDNLQLLCAACNSAKGNRT